MFMPTRPHLLAGSSHTPRGANSGGPHLRSIVSAESPIAGLTLVAMVLAAAVAQLATSIPNPADQGFTAVLAMVAGFAGGAWEWARTGSWARIQLQAFKFGFVATGVGINLYAFGLITGLY